MKDDRPGIFDGDVFIPAGSGIAKTGLNFKRIIPTILVLSFVVVPIIAASIFFANLDNIAPLEYRDKYEHSGNVNGTVHLIVDNVSGEINVQTDSTMSGYAITTTVYSNNKAKEKYNNYQWDITPTSNFLELKFIGPNTLRYDERLEYDHEIILPIGVELEVFDISTVSGNMNVDMSNAILEDAYLNGVSGNIGLNFQDCTLLGSLTADSVSSNVNIDLYRSKLNVTKIRVDVTSGDIALDFQEISINQDMDVVIDTVSGEVQVYWNQQSLNNDVNFNIDTTSGEVNIDLIFNPDITVTYNTDNDFGDEIPDNNVGTTGSVQFSIDTVSGQISINYN